LKKTRAALILIRALPVLAMLGLFVAAETALRVRRGPPPLEPEWGNLDFYYSDIYKPFFKRTPGPSGEAVFVANRARSWPQEFPAEKAKGTVRIFVVGGSVAIPYGPPNDAQLIFLKYLGRTFPGKKFELIGCGMGGYDSYREALVQKEILDYQPDAVVLMSGNNEYFTPETASPALYHLTARLRKLWVFRLALDRMKSLRPVRAMTLQDRLAGFEANLRLMAERAREKKVPMIFCTLPANIRDAPPLRSPPPVDDRDYIDARAAFDDGDDLLAAREFAQYVSAHPEEPFGQYWLAKALDRRGLFTQAREHYLRALELDDPGERCSKARNEVIRRVAKETGMILADLDAEFDAVAEHELPDGRIFVDACHWRKEYYALTSWVILRSIADAARTGATPLLSSDRWEWGWYDSERARILKPAFSPEAAQAYGDSAVYKAMTYAAATNGNLSESAVALFEEAARRNPARLDVLAGSFELIQPALGKFPWLNDSVDRLRAHWPEISIHVGEAYRRQRNYAKALRYFDGVLRLGVSRDRPLLLKAMTLAAMGRLPDARTCLEGISEASLRLPEFAYWRARIGGGGK
jgi:tetratricopeptide (TPR) repeat protein